MNIREIKELLKAFDKSQTNILEFENEEYRIYLDKSANVTVQDVNIQQPQQTALSAPAEQPEASAPAAENNTCEEGEIIASPMVGTFYQAPSPDSPPYVKAGDKVKKGQTICIIEAMKIMNELEAEFDCEILEILVEDGQPVEFDTPLFRVKRV